jgi:SAM-dependent methyltransferase
LSDTSADLYEGSYFDERNDPRRQEMRLQELRRVLERTKLEHGTILDIGCGLGEFLDLFPEDRWRRFGIEVSRHAKETCRAKGVSFELPDDEGWCDLVVCRGSLQHLDRPVEMLWNAHRWLRSGGWFVALATPNAGGLVYRLFQDLPPLVPELNFVVFSDRVLRQSLLNIGFKDVEFVYPYLHTPYAEPLRDHLKFGLRLVGVNRPFAFWRNMMECYARR